MREPSALLTGKRNFQRCPHPPTTGFRLFLAEDGGAASSMSSPAPSRYNRTPNPAWNVAGHTP